MSFLTEKQVIRRICTIYRTKINIQIVFFYNRPTIQAYCWAIVDFFQIFDNLNRDIECDWQDIYKLVAKKYEPLHHNLQGGNFSTIESLFMPSPMEYFQYCTNKLWIDQLNFFNIQLCYDSAKTSVKLTIIGPAGRARKFLNL